MGWGAINNIGLLEQFEAHLSSLALAPATIVNYMADLRAFLRWSEKRKGATSSPLGMGTSDIEAYCSFLQETKSHAPATVNRRIQALRKFYTFTAAQGWTRANPAEGASLLNEVASERSRFLTSKDVERLLVAVRNGRPRWVERDWAIIQVLVGAGLKLGELTQLRLSDFHQRADQPSLNVGDASGESKRIVPLEAEVYDALLSYLPVRQAASGVDYLFVNRDGNPLSRKVYKESSDLETVAQRLGHRHLATTIRYLRPDLSPGEQHSTENLEES
jgi:site-specific recombinase XerD